MKQYMLVFSLGPVQLFIEQARKTRDLWLGSFLMAKLMEAAMKKIDGMNLGEVFVFPTERTLNQKNANLPSKYVAIFDKKGQAQNAVDLSKEGIKECWDTICGDVWKKIIPRDYAHDKTLKEIWDKQSDLETFFETFWVIVEGNSESYSAWLQRAELALEARKHLNDFQPREEPGEKSTISGERQALHGALNNYQNIRDQVKQFWIQLSSNRSISAKDISKDGSERLDAIDTIKRFASESRIIDPEAESQEISYKQAFPSTSSIATASFVERLLGIDATKLQAWRDATEESLAIMGPNAIPYLYEGEGKNKWILRYDGDCFFTETFTARRLEKDYTLSQEQAKELAVTGRSELKVLLAVADKLSIRRPTPYYAIIKMDGDRMGELLKEAHSKGEHIKTSEALSYFSRTLASSLIQDQYPGRLVYAGGDDVLALAPLARDIPVDEHDKEGIIHTLLNLVDKLQQQYRERIEKEVPNIQVTAKMGIAIAHHYTALSAVLRATREAEKLAKERYGRNALVVTVMRRSGEQTKVGCHWRYKKLGADNDPRQPINLFTRFYRLFDQDILSPKCIYNLLEEAPPLVILDLEGEEKLKAQASEVKRVLLRQRNDKKKNQLPDGEVAKLAQYLVELANAMDEAIDEEHKGQKNFTKSVYLHEDKLRYGLVETLGWLQVMVFMTRKEQD